MQFKEKWLTGLLKSFSLVDSILIQQGFLRYGNKERPTYQLKIQDSATNNTYYLKIPTIVYCRKAGKDITHIGNPELRSQSTPSSYEIPPSIRRAVESKLAEIADYLNAYHR